MRRPLREGANPQISRFGVKGWTVWQKGVKIMWDGRPNEIRTSWWLYEGPKLLVLGGKNFSRLAFPVARERGPYLPSHGRIRVQSECSISWATARSQSQRGQRSRVYILPLPRACHTWGLPANTTRLLSALTTSVKNESTPKKCK